MKVNEMQNKQYALDHYIAEEKKLGEPYQEKYREKSKLALLVELGELANETRCFKDWSTKGPGPKERILDEIADCIHFLLKMLNFDDINMDIEFMDNTLSVGMIDYIGSRKLVEIFTRAFYAVTAENWKATYDQLTAICIKLGYTKREVLEAYEKKLAENYKRQETGY